MTTITLDFTDDESAALSTLAVAVFGADLDPSELDAAIGTAAKEQLRRWMLERKIDLDTMMLSAQWKPAEDHESVVARTQDWRDAVTLAETQATNERIRQAELDRMAEIDAATEAGDTAEVERIRALPAPTGD